MPIPYGQLIIRSYYRFHFGSVSVIKKNDSVLVPVLIRYLNSLIIVHSLFNLLLVSCNNETELLPSKIRSEEHKRSISRKLSKLIKRFNVTRYITKSAE